MEEQEKPGINPSTNAMLKLEKNFRSNFFWNSEIWYKAYNNRVVLMKKLLSFSKRVLRHFYLPAYHPPPPN